MAVEEDMSSTTSSVRVYRSGSVAPESADGLLSRAHQSMEAATASRKQHMMLTSTMDSMKSACQSQNHAVAAAVIAATMMTTT